MDSTNKNPPLEIKVQRPAHTLDSINENYAYQRPNRKGCCHATKKILSREFSSARIKRGLKARLPVVECVRNYSREYIVGDVVAGITVGIMQIPLGMAYAILGSCPAVTGLYSSFFPVLIYFFLGTSRHVSQGTFAITSLLFGKVVDKLAPPVVVNSTHSNITLENLTTTTTTTTAASVSGDETTYSATQVATALCLITGVVQAILGFLRVGALSVYLSDTLISGFTTGAAVLVFTSQFGAFFEITVPKYDWPFEIVNDYKYVFTHLGQTNIPTLIIGLVSVVVLAFTCEVINPRAMLKFKVPVPIELLTVIVGTGISYAMSFKENYNVKIVGEIQSGLPAPTVPPVTSLFSEIVVDAIVIAIVTYVISFSLARMFAKKYNYDVNANQEFYAMGIANFASSFFSCFPMCVALSRSMVSDGVGGKTQVSGLLSCVIVFIVLVAIAPLFRTLPNAVLAAIIVVGIRRMFLQFRDLVHAWKISKLEGLTWIVTFLAVCFISIDVGLGIGVVFSLFTIILRSQRPHVTTLGYVKETDFYLDVKKYSSAIEDAYIKVYHYGGPILFANSKSFRKTIYEISGINPRIIFKKMEKLRKKRTPETEKPSQNIVIVDMSGAKADLDNQRNSILRPMDSNQNLRGISNPTFENEENNYSYNISGESSQTVDDINAINEKKCKQTSDLDIVTNDSKDDLTLFESNNTSSDNVILKMKKGVVAIVIDGSAISCIDFSGVAAVTQVVEEYEKIGIEIFFAALPGSTLEMLESCEFSKQVQANIFYPTIRDAVLHVGTHNFDQKDLSHSATKL